MSLKSKIEEAILKVSPSLDGTKLLSELVTSIKRSVEDHIEKMSAQSYEEGEYRGRHPIEYSEHR